MAEPDGKSTCMGEGDLQAPTTRQTHHHQEALGGIKKGSIQFKDLPKELRDDMEIALAAILESPYGRKNWRFVSARLRNNKEFVLAAVKQGGYCFLKCASEALRSDREIVLAAVRDDARALHFAAKELRSDREVVLEAVRQSVEALAYASAVLRDNREVVLEAARHDSNALRYASQELWADREFVLAAVRQECWALRYASEELRGDHEVVLAAVQKYGWALLYAPEELCGNREIVLEAVRESGWALQYASEELSGDRVVVLEAVRQYAMALEYASAELCNDREVVLVAIHGAEGENVANVFEHVSTYLQNDPMVAGEIIRKRRSLRRGSEIMVRLENVLLAVRALPEAFVENVVDEESAVQFSRRWEQSVWHKIWMGLRLEPPGMQGTGRLFVELSGLQLELRQAKELSYCAPVIGAVLSLPRDWKDLDSYLCSGDDSADG